MAETFRTQLVGVALIVIGCVLMYAGETHGWGHMVDFANMVGGGGLGLITGQHLQAKASTESGNVNVQAAPQA